VVVVMNWEQTCSCALHVRAILNQLKRSLKMKCNVIYNISIVAGIVPELTRDTFNFPFLLYNTFQLQSTQSSINLKIIFSQFILNFFKLFDSTKLL
jgi:hypothetical protein